MDHFKNNLDKIESYLAKPKIFGLNYYYLAPIIAAERSKIVSRRILQRAAHARTLYRFKQAISFYYPELLQKDQFRHLHEIHWLFQQILTRVFFKVIKNSPERDHDFLEVFLMKFEIQNIKTILRAKILNIEPDEIKRDLNLYVEQYLNHEKLFQEFLTASNVDEIIEISKNTHFFYAPYILDAYRREKETNSLTFLDIYLDRSQIIRFWEEYEHLSSKNRMAVEPYLLLFTEYYNLITIFRGKRWNFDLNVVKELIFPYYYQTTQEITKALIETKDLQDFLNLVFKKNLDRKISFFNFNREENLTWNEIILNIKKIFYKKVLHYIKQNRIFSFDIAMAVSFFLERKFEIQDLKTISTGIDYGLDPKVLIENSILLMHEH